MQFNMNQIGVIHTPFKERAGMPIQSAHSEASGYVEVDPQYEPGLAGTEEFSHLILLYAFHQSPPEEAPLQVRPFLDNELHGVFATRYPCRPNPLGLSVVQVVGRSGCRLDFTGADILDGTPLLDIKPYIPDFDVHKVTRIGWYAHRSQQSAKSRF